MFIRTKPLYLIYNFNFMFFTLHFDSKLFLYNTLNLLHSNISSCTRPHMENKEGGSIYISIFEALFENRKIRNHNRVRSEGTVSSAHTHTSGRIIFLQKKSYVLTKTTCIFKSWLTWRAIFSFLGLR